MGGAVCTACNDEFDVIRDVSSLQCGHIFHADCIQAWFNHSMTCPQCYQEVAQDAVIPKLSFTRPDGGDSAAGVAPSSELEVSRLSSELEEVQEKLHQREQEVAELSADGSAKDDKFNELTERYRLPLILKIQYGT